MKPLHTFGGWCAAILPALGPLFVPTLHTLIAAHPTLQIAAAAVAVVGASVAAVGPGAINQR